METFIRTYKISDITLCDRLIEYHTKNKEYKKPGIIYQANGGFVDKSIKESIDVRFFNGSAEKVIEDFFTEMTTHVYKYVKEFALDTNLITEDPGLIQWYPKGGGFKKWHFERCNYLTRKRQIVYMLYLNDVKDGGTEWHFQNVKMEAVKGNLVLWPSDFTHVHRGVVANEEKYICTGWLEHCP